MSQEIDTQHDSDDTKSNSNASRRTFLKGVSAAGLCAAGANATTGTVSAHHGYMDDYGTVIDLVDDAGADPTGEESINPLLEEYADDDTMLILPNGRYKMDRQFRFTGFENFCITGTWGTTIVPENFHDFDDDDDWNYRLFRLGIGYSPGEDLVFRDLTVNMTADDTGIRVLEAAISDRMLVENVTVEGEHDSGTWGPLRTVMTDPDGTGVVRNFNAPDGGAWTEDTPGDKLWRGPTGIVCNTNKGTMKFENCTVGAFPDNGLYAAHGEGQVIVDGGTYKNSQTASVRIGGKDSIVRNARMVVDDSSGRGSQRPLRVENSNYVRIINCDIEVSDPNGDAIKTHDVNVFYLIDSHVKTAGDDVVHGIQITNDTKRARIKDSTFEHEAAGGYSLYVHPGEEPVYAERTKFTGNGGHRSARAAIHCERDASEFRALDIDQTGSRHRCGFEVEGDDCLFYKGSSVVSKHPIVNVGDSTWIESYEARSVNGHAAVELNDGDDVLIKKSTLHNGVEENGGNYYGWSNDFE